jgi:very-short-patch-repair endonuclease
VGVANLSEKSQKARGLRKVQTDAESVLWRLLRSRQLAGYKFRRQHPVAGFVADFACIKSKLIVEADGGQHNENASDAARTATLTRQGWLVLRFWNHEILTNADGVLMRIAESLEQTPPHPRQRANVCQVVAFPPLPPQAGGEGVGENASCGKQGGGAHA